MSDLRTQPNSDSDPLVQQLRGRAEFLRNRMDGVKSPDLMDRAADRIEFLEGQVEGLQESFSSLADIANTVPTLKARIEELESNERAYEKILGKRTYREVADRMKEMEEALQIARTFISDEPIEHAIVNVHSMQSLVQLLDAALEAKHD